MTYTFTDEGPAPSRGGGRERNPEYDEMTAAAKANPGKWSRKTVPDKLTAQRYYGALTKPIRGLTVARRFRDDGRVDVWWSWQ